MDKFDEYLNKFTKLAEAAEFYLDESFDFINRCLESELSSILFKEFIMTVDTSNSDIELMEKAIFPEEILKLLTSQPPEVITDETIENIDRMWNHAQQIASFANHNFQKNQKIDSIELLGHVTNFAFFFETLVNRHLLFLLVSKQIDEFTYNNLNQSKILNRLSYIFKNELIKGTVSLNEIANLFKLRNKTVHFTPDNSISMETTIESLMKIWKQTKLILDRFQAIEKLHEEKFSELIEDEILNIKERFLSKENIMVKDLIERVRVAIKKHESS